MSDPRPVCRRCKKKRPLDEPLETARYRTCKPCREIERKKKRLKKLELQGKNPNNINVAATVAAINSTVDSLPKPNYEQNIINIANEVQRNLPHHHIQQYDNQLPPPVLAPIQQQQQQHHQQQHKKPDDREIPIDELLLKEGVSSLSDHGDHDHGDLGGNARTLQLPNQSRVNQLDEQHQQQLTEGAVNELHKATHHELSNSSDDLDKSTDENNLFAAIRNAENAAAAAAAVAIANATTNVNDEFKDENVCLYCGATRTIEDNGRYKLCGNCVENPLDTDNVFNDFDQYLDRIALGQVSDLRNIIFIRRFDQNDDTIPDFIQYSEDKNNLETIIVELNNKFINPLMERSGFKFLRSSSNFSTKPHLKSIKLLFKCKQDIKTVQKLVPSNTNPSITNAAASAASTAAAAVAVAAGSGSNGRRLKTEDCQSNVYVSYDLAAKTLSIKYNHKTHKPYLEKIYSRAFIEKVKEISASLTDLNEVFNYLKDNAFLNNVHDEDLKVEITLLKKSNFIKDFSHF